MSSSLLVYLVMKLTSFGYVCWKHSTRLTASTLTLVLLGSQFTSSSQTLSLPWKPAPSWSVNISPPNVLLVTPLGPPSTLRLPVASVARPTLRARKVCCRCWISSWLACVTCRPNLPTSATPVPALATKSLAALTVPVAVPVVLAEVPGKPVGRLEAQKELRTLVDYASDLDSVWNRAFDIRFGVSIARDNSAEALQSLKDRAEEAQIAIRDARQQIQELRASLQQLAADRSILQYQLGVAIEYGDELRAAQIRAELADNAAEAKDRENELADANKELKSAQDEATKSLTGNTEGSRANREQVMALVQAYQAEIIALANSGASTDQLNARTQQLRAEFVRQLTQMGYNRSEVERYAKSFDDLRVVIGRVPRNITVRANANPAQQALNEFVARNNNRRINMRVSTSGLPRSVSGGTYRPSRVNVGSGGISTPRINTNRTDTNIFDVWQTRTKKSHNFNFAGGGKVGYLASGGVHGLHPGAPRGTDTVPAWLTPGEFVQRKKAVDYYGLPFMNAINSLKFPKYLAAGTPGGGTGGGGAGPRIQAVVLLPHQMRQLADMISIDIDIWQRQIAGAANSSNVRDSRRGRN